MGKVITEKTGHSIPADQSHSYLLYGLLGSDSLSYFVLDQQDSVQAIHNHSWDIKETKALKEVLSELLQSDKQLFQSYKKVHIGLDHNAHTLVPNRLFTAKNAVQYLENILPWADALECRHESVNVLDAENVYAVSRDISQVLKSYLPQATISHLDTSFIQACKQFSSVKEGKKIFLNVRGNNLHTLYFSEDSLILNNRYRYQSAQDFLYYTMLLFDQFRLDPEKIPVWLSGGIQKNSENFKILYRYIRHINFMPVPAFLNFDASISHDRLYQYYDLFSLKLIS